ncbi:DUF397 domain-containing protein [Streptomyces longisporoflavus]|uniref:DUF397 domain-containing protein n=1 Tax=Streptomyces longisporoflavus TaxID=28044 RepID=A0ABW7QXL7_9ACTN
MSDELKWFKSSYSGPEGDACVEVALDWRKSTYSDDEGSNCVEIAPCPTAIHVRDSKLSPETGPHLTVPAPAWSAFLAYATRSR